MENKDQIEESRQLEPEEVKDLLNEFSSEEIGEAAMSSLPELTQPNPEDISDFSFGDEENGPDKYPLFLGVQERTIKDWRETWSELFNKEIDIKDSNIINTSYLEMINEPEKMVYFSFDCDGLGRMLVAVEMNLIVSAVNSMLGGDGEVNTESASSLSPVEFKLSRRISKQIERFMEDSWAPIKELDFKPNKIDTEHQFLAVAGNNEKVFGSSAKVAISESVVGTIRIAYPISFIEPILDTLRINDQGDDLALSDPEWDKSLRDAVNDIEVTLTVELGRIVLKIHEFLNLKEGDFLDVKKKQGDILLAKIRDSNVFEVTVGDKDGTLVAEITNNLNGDNDA